MELTDELTEAIEQVEGVETTNHGGPVDRMQAEQDAIEELEQAVSEAVRSDGTEFELENIPQIASEARNFLPNHTKTDVKNRLRDKVEEDSDLEKPEMTRWIESNVVEIVHVRTTDHKQDLVTEFHLESNDTLNVQLNPNTGGLKYRAPEWWKEAVETATGTRLAEPEQSSDEIDWHDWVDALLRGERGASVTEKSPIGNRTQAVRALQGEIRESRAYTNLADAIAEGTLYVDDDAGEVYVPQGRITDLLEDQTVGVTGFRRELDARGYCTNEDGKFSVTEKATVEGSPRWQDYWKFDIDVADPAVVDPDGSDAVEAVQQAVSGHGSDKDENSKSNDDVEPTENSEEDSDGESGSHEVNVGEAVKSQIEDSDEDRLEKDTIIDSVAAEYEPLTKDDVEREIAQLKQQGKAYEPSTGVLALI